jgi:hypothetical protein
MWQTERLKPVTGTRSYRPPQRLLRVGQCGGHCLAVGREGVKRFKFDPLRQMQGLNTKQLTPFGEDNYDAIDRREEFASAPHQYSGNAEAGDDYECGWASVGALKASAPSERLEARFRTRNKEELAHLADAAAQWITHR